MEGAVPKEKGGGADVVAGLSKLKAGVALFYTRKGRQPLLQWRGSHETHLDRR